MYRISRIAAVLVPIAGLILHASAALAAPVHPQPDVDAFIVSCPGGDVALLSPPITAREGVALYPPAFVLGTHQLFVPYSFFFTVSDGVNSYPNSYAKNAPVPSDAVSCTIAQSFFVGDTTYTFTGTIVSVLRGQP